MGVTLFASWAMLGDKPRGRDVAASVFLLAAASAGFYFR